MKQYIFGLGTGRCGTISLTSLLNRQKDVQVRHEALHETASWKFNEHYIKSLLKAINNYNGGVVGDVSFYNLPYVQYLLDLYKNIKFICLKRDKEEVVDSYVKKTGPDQGGPARNHWSEDNSGWRQDPIWDKCYPKYNLPKREAIAAYWEEYYRISTDYENRYPDNFKIFKMEDVLNSEKNQRDMFEFIGLKEISLKTNITLNTSKSNALTQRNSASIYSDQIDPDVKANFSRLDQMHLWLYWENYKGSSEPAFIRLCRDSINKHCSEEFEVVLVTPDNLFTYLPDLRKDLDDIRRRGFEDTPNIAMKTDYIRVALLHEYGGIWLDSDMIIMQSFGIIKTLLAQYNFVGYLHWDGHVTNGFLASTPKGKVISRYKSMLDQTLDKNKILPWGMLGSKLITPIAKTEPGVYLFKRESFHPIRWYDSELFFMEDDVDKYVTESTLCTALFNDVFPSDFKQWSREEILNSDMLISKIFRKSLGYDSTMPNGYEHNNAEKPIEYLAWEKRQRGFSFCIISAGRRPEKLSQLISSIRDQDIPAYEIIVAGACPPCEEAVCVDMPQMAQRGKISALRNAAAEKSRYSHLVFVDDDIVFLDGWYAGIEACVDRYDLVTSRFLNLDGTRFWDWSTIGGPRGHVMLDYDDFDEHVYITGGLLVTTAKVWQTIRWDPQRGINQFEDVDFSRRAKTAGFTFYCCQNSMAVHNDPRYTQVGRRVYVRTEDGVRTWLDDQLSGLKPAELMDRAVKHLQKGLIAEAADCIRYCLWVDPDNEVVKKAWNNFIAHVDFPVKDDGIWRPYPIINALAREGGSVEAKKKGIGARNPSSDESSHSDYGSEKDEDTKRTHSAFSNIVWHAPIFDPSGYADEARNLILHLHDANIKPAVREIGRRSDFFREGLAENTRNQLDEAIAREARPGGISVVHFPAYAFKRVRNARFHIGRTTFETDGLPADWVQECNRMDEIWVPSEFNMHTFNAAGVTSRLYKVPEGVATERFKPANDVFQIPGARGIVFLSIFEWIYRKGWDVLLKSWAQAFGPDDYVSLVLRTYPINAFDAKGAQKEIDRRINLFLETECQKERNEVAPIVVLADQLSDHQMPHLYAAANAYVLASRGEGWGRTQMEAMACGLPVISTRWGGNLEFMNDGNSLLIDIDGLNAIDGRAEIPFYRGQKWAEPSCEHLCELMHRVVKSPTQVRKMGQQARLDVEHNWSWEKVAKIAAHRLREIQSELNRHPVSGHVNAIHKIKWEGSQFVHHSLALVNRELCLELAGRRDVELSIIPYEPHVFGIEEDPDRFQPIEERLHSPLSGPADFHIRHQWPPNFTPPPEGHWIMIQPWEFGSLPKEWIRPLETLVDEIWVPTNYVRNVYLQSGISADKVFVVPNGVNAERFHPEASALKLDTRKKFKFLFVGGTIWRKGIDLLLEAYCSVFSIKDDVCLVIKDMGNTSFYRNQNATQLIGQIKDDQNAPEILYLSDDIGARQMAGLYTACDCLVHPYRGEGFGLPVAEAMACGLPVVVTQGGACDDFCHPKNAYLLNSKTQAVRLSECELSGKGWVLEPDVSHLKELLQKVYQHQSESRRKGQAAARQIRQSLNWANAANRVVARLQALRSKPIRRLRGNGTAEGMRLEDRIAEPKNEKNQAKLENPKKDASVQPLEQLPPTEAQPSPEASYQRIITEADPTDPESSLSKLNGLLNEYPTFGLAHNDLGVLYSQLNEKEKALRHYRQAVAIQPKNTTFKKNLADFLCLKMGRIEEAVQHYLDVLQESPQDIEVLKAMATICIATEKTDDAKYFLESVLQLEPEDPEVRDKLDQLNRLGETSRRIGSPHILYRTLLVDSQPVPTDEKIRRLQSFLRAYPDYAAGHNDIGALFQSVGDNDHALYHYRRAAQIEPDNDEFQRILADYLFSALNRIDEALSIYRGILSRNPRQVDTLMMVGHLCTARQKFGEAEDCYRQVLKLQPDHSEACGYVAALGRKAAGIFAEAGRSGVFQGTAIRSKDAAPPDPNDTEGHPAHRDARLLSSIIIVLDGRLSRIKRCLRGIQAHCPNSHEVLLVGYRAKKGALHWAQQQTAQHSHIRLVDCDAGETMASALNRALTQAGGDIIVTLHHDVLVAKGWLDDLTATFKQIDNVGVVGPMSNRGQGPQALSRLEVTAKSFDRCAAGFREMYRHRRIPVGWLGGRCLAFESSLIEKIGPFDANYQTDEYRAKDFCLRAALMGRQNFLAGAVVIYHDDHHGQKAAEEIRNQDRAAFEAKWNGFEPDGPVSQALEVSRIIDQGCTLFRQEKITDAVDAFMQGIGSFPDSERLYFQLADQLKNAGKFQQALEAMAEMPASGATSSVKAIKVTTLKGYCHEGVGDDDKADAYLRQALDTDSTYAPALNLKGILAYKKDNITAAEDCFRQAIDSDPGYGEAYTNLGAIGWARGEKKPAFDLMQKGFVLNPLDAEMTSLFHSALAELGNYDQAETVVWDAAGIHPDSKKLQYLLIDLLNRQQKYPEAMSVIEKAIATFGFEDGILPPALTIRRKLGQMTIKPHDSSQPAVSLCMIVKDEERDLARCLHSVKPIVDEMIVVDTGSSDRTKDIATVYGAAVYDFEWRDDFAAARNFSLSKASGDWILVMDADEVISPLDYDAFRRIVGRRYRSPQAYSITTRNYNTEANILGWISNSGRYAQEEAGTGWLPSHKVRLFTRDDRIRFEGKVHEMVDPVLQQAGIKSKSCPIPVHHYGRLNREKLNQKGETYYRIGLAKLEQTGGDLRSLRELATQAGNLNHSQEAIALWQRFLKLELSPALQAEAYVNMGTAYSRMGQYQKALKSSKQAIQADPDMKEAHYNYALALLHVKDADTAASVLENLLERIPDYPPALFILTAAYACTGRARQFAEGVRRLKAAPMARGLVHSVSDLAKGLIAAKNDAYACRLIQASLEHEIVDRELLELYARLVKLNPPDMNAPYGENDPVGVANMGP